MEYIRSERNQVADGLSRLPVLETAWSDDDTVQIASLMGGGAIDLSEFEEASSADKQLSAVRSALQGQWPSRRSRTDEWLTAFFSVRSELSSQGALIFRGDRLVVPVELRARVLANAHVGHQGPVRTKQRLRERFSGHEWTLMCAPTSESVKYVPIMMST